MQTEDYEYLYELEATFWWFAGMRTITGVLLDPLLRAQHNRAILDAGCGCGGNLEWLQRYAGQAPVTGLDFVFTALGFCQQLGQHRLTQASATDLPFADESFDLITSFDVLVQIPGAAADEQAMREMWRVLKPGGYAFVRGAAYEWMKSGHDDALDTQRRYTLPELRTRLERSGFKVMRSTYAMSLLFPVAALRRLVFKQLGLADTGSDVKPLAPALRWLNGILRGLLLLEAAWLRVGNLPFGLSAICVVQKPRDAKTA